MSRRTYVFATLYVVIAVLIAAGGFLISAQEPDGRLPHDGTLLYEIFADAEPGVNPPGWKFYGKSDLVKVVAASQTLADRAVHIVGHPERLNTGMAKAIDAFWQNDTAVLVIEHGIRWIHGSGINFYFETAKPEGHNINWYFGPDGDIGIRYAEGGAVRSQRIASLQDGWNRVRLLADREADEIYVFLNDMSDPVAGPFPFRKPVGSWLGTQLRVSSAGTREDEAYHGYFHVWAK